MADERIKCCNNCYKKLSCAGSGWYCDLCDKDRNTCKCYKFNRGEPVKFKDEPIICSCRSCC